MIYQSPILKYEIVRLCPDTLTPQIYLDDYDSSRALVLQSIVSYIGS